MENKKIVFLLTTVVILVAIGYFLVSSGKSNNSVGSNSQQVASGQTNGRQNPEFSKRYIGYSPENLKEALNNGGKAVIFFHAGWCPTCQAAERDFKANFDKVPKNVTILRTDYDTSTQLKLKYNVAYQDTFVEVDSQGNEVVKWNSGGQGILALLANLK